MQRRVKPDLAVPVGEHDHVRGPAGAPTTIVMYGDYECPYTRKAIVVIDQLQQEAGEHIRFAFRHFPLRVIHRQAQQAAEAAEAANAQGKFWSMHRVLLEYPWNLDQESLVTYAAAIGLDVDLFEQSLRARRYADAVEEDLLTGVASGIEATPTLFVNGKRLVGILDRTTIVQMLLQVEEQSASPRLGLS
jgi:protein-disulfide isomerase